METALFSIEHIRLEGGRTQVIDVQTWTPEGENIKLQIEVDVAPAPESRDGEKNSSNWSARGVVFRSLGKPSEGMAGFFQRQSGQKKAKGGKAKLKKEIPFAARCVSGDMAKVGEDKVELHLRSESQMPFACRLLIQRNTDVFLIIPDEYDAAALQAFCG